MGHTIIVIAFQSAVYFVVYNLLKQCYFNQAKNRTLGAMEVADWVNQQMGGLFSNNIFCIMGLVTIAIILYTAGLYMIPLYMSNIIKLRWLNLINMYEYKKRFIVIPAITFISEIVIIILFNLEILVNNIGILCVTAIIYILKFVFELLNLGIVLPVEMKAPYVKPVIGIINRMLDEVLKEL